MLSMPLLILTSFGTGFYLLHRKQVRLQQGLRAGVAPPPGTRAGAESPVSTP